MYYICVIYHTKCSSDFWSFIFIAQYTKPKLVQKQTKAKWIMWINCQRREDLIKPLDVSREEMGFIVRLYW